MQIQDTLACYYTRSLNAGRRTSVAVHSSAMSIPTNIMLQLVSILLLYVIVKLIWRAFFSPLGTFPGPFASKFTDTWRAFLTTRGNVDAVTRGWHRKWGQAVRIGPNTISLSDTKLIKEVYASTTKNAWKKVRKKKKKKRNKP